MLSRTPSCRDDAHDHFAFPKAVANDEDPGGQAATEQDEAVFFIGVVGVEKLKRPDIVEHGPRLSE
mgnify:CR=1 FL=1